MPTRGLVLPNPVAEAWSLSPSSCPGAGVTCVVAAAMVTFGNVFPKDVKGVFIVKLIICCRFLKIKNVSDLIKGRKAVLIFIMIIIMQEQTNSEGQRCPCKTCKEKIEM